MRPVAGVLVSAALFLLLAGLEWEGSRARWLRDLAEGDPGQRADALHGLAALPGPEVDAAIAHALEDDAEDVRIEAALACEARRLSACAAIVGGWLDDTSPDVRAVAARVLGHTGSDADAPRLARMLGDARPQVRRAAVLGLRALAGAAAVEALTHALADADPIVRERAAEALGATASDASGRTLAVTALLSRTRDDAPEVRAAALDALGELGDPRASAAAVVAMDDDVIDVQLAAMRALTRVPSALAVSALAHASTDDDRLGRAALAALAHAPGAAALDALVSALRRPAVARSAEDALELRMQVGEEARVEAIGALARGIASPESPDAAARLAASAVRLSASVSIAGLEAALVEALRTEPSASVLEALGRTGAEEALVPVLDALASEDASMRSAALGGLEGWAGAHAPDGRVLDPLSLAFPRLDAGEQARAIAVVGRVRSERAAAWLLARLDDGARPARVAVLRALRAGMPPEAAPRLAALLSDSDAEVRTRAALALAGTAAGSEVDDAVLRGLAQALVADEARDRHAILLALGPMVRACAEGEARREARSAILLALDAADPELADSAALAVAASHDAGLSEGALARARDAGPTIEARMLRALAGARGLEAARTFALGRLDAADPRVALAAYATLAEIGGAAEAGEIARRVSGLRFPANAAAAFALARMAGRDVSVDVPALGTLAEAHDPYVRADVAIAAAHAHVASLGEGRAALDWLGVATSPLVRAAAARWAFATRDAAAAARVDEALAACASDPTQPPLARACASPAFSDETADADVVALDASGHVMPSRLVALRLADGSALVTYTDARGRVRLEAAPAGPFSLDAPESAVLVP